MLLNSSFWLALLIAVSICQRFDYFDSSMRSVDTWPQVVIDRVKVPLYVITNTNDGTAIWNYSNRSVLQILSDDDGRNHRNGTFSSDYLWLVTNNCNYSDSVCTITTWKRSQNLFVWTGRFTVQQSKHWKTLISKDASYSFSFFSRHLSVYKISGSGSAEEPSQMISGEFIAGTVLCNDNLLLLDTNSLTTYSMDPSSLKYRLVSLWALDSPVVSVPSSLESSSNGKVLLVADGVSKIRIFLTEESHILELPVLCLETSTIENLTLNNDGSAFTFVDSKGVAHLHERALNRTSVPDAFDSCEWSYTAYVCNCSSIQGSNSSGSNLLCSCQEGYNWQDYACVLDPSRFTLKIGGAAIDPGLIVGLSIAGALILIAIIGVSVSYCCCCRPAPPSRSTLVYPGKQSIPRKLPQSPYFYENNLFLKSPAGLVSDVRIKPRPEEIVCSICLMEYTNCTTSCSHRFHLDCIRLWMRKDKTCPNCRVPGFQVLSF